MGSEEARALPQNQSPWCPVTLTLFWGGRLGRETGQLRQSQADRGRAGQLGQERLRQRGMPVRRVLFT